MAEIKMVVTDMDGSAVRFNIPPFYSGWDAIGNLLPNELREKWYETRDYYYPKKELYQEWFEEQLLLLKEIEAEYICKKIFPLPYAPGFIEFFGSLPKTMIKGLISAGVDLIANKIKEDAALDFVYSNEIHIENGKFTGKGKAVQGLWSKITVLKKVAEEYNLTLEEICFIGDNLNDKECLIAVGRPYLINPHKDIQGLAPEITDYREIKLD